MWSIAGKAVREKTPVLVEQVVKSIYGTESGGWQQYGETGRQKSLRDVAYHLSYLAEALDADDPVLFSEYLAWIKVVFAGLNFADDVLTDTLDHMRLALSTALSPDVRPIVLSMVDRGRRQMHESALDIPSFLDGSQPMDMLARAFLDALLKGERHQASEMILAAVKHGSSIKDIYSRVFERTQREIGRLWQMNFISVAQEHFCTAATQMVMSQLYPQIFTGERKGRRMVTTCVGGELHEIGARMVADFFEMEGWDTYFLGANTPLESILRTLEEEQADVLAISATMTFHVSTVAQLIGSLRQHTNIAQTRVLVGGYPFNLSPRLWQKIGADGYALDAQNALIEAERVLTL